MRKLIRELRRREVFRTAGLYVGICWLAIEVASVVLPAFEAPEWTLRALIILAVVGFPVMVVLAWVYDVSDGGIHVQDEAAAAAPVPAFGRRGDFIVIGVLSVALLVSLYMNFRARSDVAVELEPLSILIADFDNRTGDAVFDGSLEQALEIGIEGASFVTSYRRNVAEEIAAALSPDAGLDAAAARLVAVREGIKLVLAGSIAADHSGYEIAVSAISPRDGEVVADADTFAAGKLQVLTAMEEIVKDLRRQLGDESVGRGGEGAETYTVRSLEAAKEYDTAQSLAHAGRYADAIERYKIALEHDPEFGRAYSGWAVAARSLGRMDEAGRTWEEAVARVGSMTERERLRTLGMYYWGVTNNYPKAIETYETLVAKYPADTAAHNNLAVQYFMTLDFQSALREGRVALDIYPNDMLTRSNYALYAMYASDFAMAVDEAGVLLEREDPYFKAWLPVAMNALAEGDADAARQAYLSMAASGARGASTANLGMADIELFTGNFAAARDVLREGIAADEALGSSYITGTKYLALAEAQLRLEDRDGALASIDKGLALTTADAIVVPAALLRIEAGRADTAAGLADIMAGKLQPQSRAYAELIRAALQLEAGRHVDAIDTLTAATSLADLWLLRFYLGRAYLAGGFHAEALDEFMAAEARHGEATALFLDDLPTYRYAATLPYWLARAQDGLGMTADAQENYGRFIARRSGDDPLAGDARQRLE